MKKGKENKGKSVYKYTLKQKKVSEVFETGEKIGSAEGIAQFAFSMDWHEHPNEHLHAVFLNSKNGINGFSLITMGLVDRSHIHARELFRNAILNNCARIVLVHNHPSGDPSPSSKDISSTREMIHAGEIIGIQIIDHIIVGEKSEHSATGFYSLRDNGFIK